MFKVIGFWPVQKQQRKTLIIRFPGTNEESVQFPFTEAFEGFCKIEKSNVSCAINNVFFKPYISFSSLSEFTWWFHCPMTHPSSNWSPLCPEWCRLSLWMPPNIQLCTNRNVTNNGAHCNQTIWCRFHGTIRFVVIMKNQNRIWKT